jgi:LysM repeat protein
MEDTRHLENRLQRLEHLVRLYRLGLGLACIIVLALLGVLLFGKTPRYGRAIIINDHVVGMVRDEKAAAMVRERLLREGRGSFTGVATFREKWEDAARPVAGARMLSVKEAVRRLTPKVTVVVEACAIEAHGQQLIVAPSEEIAKGILNKLKARYASQSDAVVKSTRLQPEPVLRPVTVPPAELVSDILQGATQLSQVRATPKQYKVKQGDYPERIAAKHGMKVGELYKLNPGLRGATLQVGQELKVLGPGAGLVVVTVKEAATTVTVPPPVERTPSAKYAKGSQKTVDPGQPGKKRVRLEITMHNEREVSRRVLSEEVITAPKAKRVLVGTA